MIDYISPTTQKKLTKIDNKLIGSDEEEFEIINHIPRFIKDSGYAKAFGYQWNIFAKTQLDSFTHNNDSLERLNRCLGFDVSGLAGKNVLEAGCGAGRFTEHLVDAGANVHAFDLSEAVDANLMNIGKRENYNVCQADIYQIPYPDNSFDVVFCLGVLQHTPDPEKSIQCLYNKVKKGGQLVIDHYTYSLARATKISSLLRYLLKEMNHTRSKKIVDALVNFFFPIHWFLRHVYFAQVLLGRISPCLFYYKMLPLLSKDQHYEITKLDTFDHLTDYYKHVRTKAQLERYLQQLGAKDITAHKGGIGIEFNCRKPL